MSNTWLSPRDMVTDASESRQIRVLIAADADSRCDHLPVDRNTLIHALQRPDPASQECRSALAGGADYYVFEGTTSIADLLTIYRRRHAHVAAISLEHGGFDQTLAELEASDDDEARLGRVSDLMAQRHYQLFLSADTDTVIACLWVLRDPYH